MAIGLTFYGCKQPVDIAEGKIRIELEATMNGEPFEIGQVYTNITNDRVRADLFKTYLSKIRAHRTDGTFEEISDIYLANFEDENTITASVEPGSFNKLTFGIGVPEELNKDNDPSVYPNDHPLSAIGAEGMFWTWNSGYIFTAFEGKADTLEGSEVEPLHPFAYHCGEDFLYLEKEHEVFFAVEDCQTETFKIVFEVDKFWYSETDTLDVTQDFLTHTSGNVELAERFMAFFDQAIYVQE